MKKLFTFLLTLLFVLIGAQAQSLQQEAGLKLKVALFGIIKNHTDLRYANLWSEYVDR